MMEHEWQTGISPAAMLRFLLRTGRLTDRKLRLFGVACCRMIWHLLPDVRSRCAVDVAEAFADGLVSADEAVAAGDAAAEVTKYPGVRAELGWRAARAADHLLPPPGEEYQLRVVWEKVATALEGEQLIKQGATPIMLDAWSEQSVESGRTMGFTKTNPDAVIAEVLREVIGPQPFRSQSVPASVLQWQGGVVLGLAAEIYGERRFQDMPILADLMKQAGLADNEVLRHLQRREHCLGCWCLDLLLGKE